VSNYDRRREVLRQASVALEGRAVTLWRVSGAAEVVPEATSFGASPAADAAREVGTTLLRWGVPVIEGSRWVGCRVNGEGTWCIAPVRHGPAAPPPMGVERRSRARVTLELAGVCLGAVLDPVPIVAARPVDPAAPDLGVIAHEVANPLSTALAALDGCAEGVRQAAGLTPAERARVLDDLEGVSEAVERAAGLLRAVQDRARGVLARLERFDAVRVVRSCARLEEPLLRRKGLSLRVAADPADVYLNGDPNALFQILTNLIRNAADASLVTRAPIEVELTSGRHALVLRVRDRGVGIRPEHLPRIFEAGYTTKGFGAGAGMGLTVVRDLAQRLFGGSVQVESEAGRGTTFTVLLPAPPQRSGAGG
jgi:anti-sigma regulatory factor (Ser/Thr protein kinase)